MTVDLDDVLAEIRPRIGTTTRVHLGSVSMTQFQRFARAVGDPNPVYVDDQAARDAGYPAVVAPPLFLSSVFEWGVGPADEDLRSDGTGGSETLGLPLDGLRLMGAGQDLEFGQPAADGTEVMVDVAVEDVERKEGRSGQFLIIVVSRRYCDIDGRMLVTCRERFIAR